VNYNLQNRELYRGIACTVRFRKEGTPSEDAFSHLQFHKRCIRSSKSSPQDDFKYSRVYSPKSSQEMVYQENVAFPALNAIASKLLPDHVFKQPIFPAENPVVPQCLTFIAFGSPQSGKTYTLFGETVHGKAIPTGPNKGIIPRLSDDLFNFIHKCSSFVGFPDITVRLSMFEIIDERIYDLLEPCTEPLKILEDICNHHITVEGLSEKIIQNETQMIDQLQRGLNDRTLHEPSTHFLFTMIKINVGSLDDLSKQTNLLFVEWKCTEEEDSTDSPISLPFRRPCSKISRLILKSVIHSLLNNSPYIPYRASKATRLLQDSFGGTTKTTFLFTCSTSVKKWDETVNTLKYARKAFDIRNNACRKHLSKFY